MEQALSNPEMITLAKILGWALENWLPLTIGAAVLAAYVWIVSLQSANDRLRTDLDAAQAEVSRVSQIAKDQALAFTVLQKTFENYQEAVEDYLAESKRLAKIAEDLERSIDGLPDDVKGAEIDVVDPYLIALCRARGGSEAECAR